MRCRNPFLCRAGFIKLEKKQKERLMDEIVAIPFYVGQVSSFMERDAILEIISVAIPFYVGQVSSRQEKVNEILRSN